MKSQRNYLQVWYSLALTNNFPKYFLPDPSVEKLGKFSPWKSLRYGSSWILHHFAQFCNDCDHSQNYIRVYSSFCLKLNLRSEEIIRNLPQISDPPPTITPPWRYSGYWICKRLPLITSRFALEITMPVAVFVILDHLLISPIWPSKPSWPAAADSSLHPR